MGITYKAVHLVEPADDVGLPVGNGGIVRRKFGDIAIWVNPVCVVPIYKHI